MSTLELKIPMRGVFGTEEHPLPGPALQHLQGMKQGIGVGTFDAHNVPCPYTKEKFMEIYSHEHDSTKRLTVVQGEELARHEAEELRQRSRAAHSPGADGKKRRMPPMKGGGEVLADGVQTTLADGPQLVATLADGAPHLAARQATGALPTKAGELPARTKGGKKKTSQNLQLFLLVALRAALHLHYPHLTSSYTATLGTPSIRATSLLPRGAPEFLALILTTANDEEEAAEEAAAEPAPGLGHPSRTTLKNCIEAGVFAPGALFRPDGSEVRTTTQPRNCTVCLEAALSHQPFPLLEPGTNCYPKLHKVYNEFLNVGHCGINDELYTLTFIDTGTRYVWIVNVEARSRVYEVFRAGADEANKASANLLDLRNAPRLAGAQLAINHRHHRQSVPTSEVDRNEGRHIYALRVGCMVQFCLPTSTIGKFASRAHWGIHLGISHEHKARLILDLMSQKITNARDVIFYERLFLEQFREDERANANRVYANDEHSYATPEDEAAATILEQDTRGEFIRGDHHSDDDDDDSPGGGIGGAGGSGIGAAPPAPPEPESDEDDVQEVIPQHRHDSTVSGLQLLGLHTATSTAPRVIDRKNRAKHSQDHTARNGASRHTSVTILLAIAAARHLPLCQIDVKNAFLYALVDAVIYVEQPHMYGDGDSHVCQLRKSLYEIKQAPRLWQQYHNILLEIGLKQLPHDPGMYHRDFRGEYILLTVYVDDLLYTGSSNELLEQFEKNLAGRVDITCNHDRPLQFFVSTPNVGLCYSTIPTASFNLIGYVDADHAADPDNRRSRAGFLFRLKPSGLISWNLQKQEPVALSSAEAEFIAAIAAIREGLYLQELLHEAKIRASLNFRLHCNNQSAIRIANKPGFVNHTKHIALRYFFIKEEVDKGKRAAATHAATAALCPAEQRCPGRAAPPSPSRPPATTAAAAVHATAAGGGGAAGSAGGAAARPHRATVLLLLLLLLLVLLPLVVEVRLGELDVLLVLESAVAPGGGESAAAVGARESADALGASVSTTTGPASAEALHTFTLDSGASRCFVRDCTTVTRLAAPVRVSLADPTDSRDFPVLGLHSDRGGEFSSDLLAEFCRDEGIRQSFTLPASPQQNGIAKRRIGLIMEVARTYMIHAAAAHFPCPFAVRYAAHQLNLWPRVSEPETSPTLRWTGKVGDASVFWVWGALSLVRDAKPSKLSSRTLRCVFLGFPTDALPWQFHHLRERRVFSSEDVTFDESVYFYRLHLHASHPGPAPSGVSQVDPPPLVEPLEISSDSSGPAEGGNPAADNTAASRRSPRLESPLVIPPRPSSPPLQPAAMDFEAETAGAEPGGAETEGEGSGCAATGGAATGGAATGGADSGGAAIPSGGGAVGDTAGGSPGGGGYGPVGARAATPGGTAGAGGTSGGAGGAAVLEVLEVLLVLVVLEVLVLEVLLVLEMLDLLVVEVHLGLEVMEVLLVLEALELEVLEKRGGRGAGGSGEAQAQGQPRDSAIALVQPSLGPPRDEPRVFGLDKFNGENFAECSFIMENVFDHYDLLEVMEGTEKRPENNAEKSAQGYLLLGQVLGSTQIRHIKPFQHKPEKGPKAWAALKGVHAPATAAVLVVLEWQMAALRIEEDEAVEEGVQKFFDLLTRLEGADLNYSELQKKTELLALLPKSWSSLIINLNHDLPHLSLENVKRAILQEDFNRRELASADGAKAASIGRGYGSGRGRGRGGGRFGGSNFNGGRGIGGYGSDDKSYRRGRGRFDGERGRGRGGRGGGAANMKSDRNESESRDDRFPGQFFFVSTQALAGPEKDEGFEEPAAEGKVTLHSLDYWVIDSGATYSMTPRADLLTELEPSPVKHVTSALGQQAEVKGMGKAMFKGADGKMVGLKNVLWVTNLAANLISVRRLQKAGMDTSLKGAKTYTARIGERILWDLHEDRDVYNEMWQIPVVPMPRRVVMDVVGPLKLGAAGAEYFLTIVDVFTHMTWVYVLSKKSDVAETMKTDWLPMVERQQVRLRANRTITETARGLLIEVGLPDYFWPDAVRSACVAKNRALTHAGAYEWVPYVDWIGRKPKVDMCMALVPKHNRHNKLGAKPIWAVHLGMAQNSKGWLLWDPFTKNFLVSRDCTFIENLMYKDWKAEKEAKISEVKSSTLEHVKLPLELSSDSTTTRQSSLVNGGKEAKDAEEEEEEVQQSALAKAALMVGDDEESNYEECTFSFFSPVEMPGDPATLKEALESSDAEEWKQAMETELKCIEENSMWEFVELPEGLKSITSKWLFKIKSDADCKIERYKSRLVAKRYQQKEKVDYKVLFAPLVKPMTLRTLLAGATIKGRVVKQIDVTTAFLNGVLEEVIFMEQPEGFDDGSGRVLKMKKALYGLKQAPRK
ncbi:unnamed protein product [Closterium sp. NIES-54]